MERPSASLMPGILLDSSPELAGPSVWDSAGVILRVERWLCWVREVALEGGIGIHYRCHTKFVWNTDPRKKRRAFISTREPTPAIFLFCFAISGFAFGRPTETFDIIKFPQVPMSFREPPSAPVSTHQRTVLIVLLYRGVI